MATFGDLTNGTGQSASSADGIVLDNGTPASSGTLETIVARLFVTAGAPLAKGIIYSDSAGLPGVPLATSDEITISNTVVADVTFTFSGAQRISLTAGTQYWFGFIYDDPGTGSLTWRRGGTANEIEKKNITYPTAPNPYGASAPLAGPLAAYVSYTPAASGTTLVVAGVSQGQTADSLSLIQDQILTVAGAQQSQTVQAPALSQRHILAATNASHTHSAQSPTLAVAVTLRAAGSTHGQTSEVLSLSQEHLLAVSGALQSHSGASPALGQDHHLVASGAVHDQLAGSPSLATTEQMTLVVAGSSHNQSAGSAALAQTHLLNAVGAVHAQAAQAPATIADTSLTVQSGAHGQTASSSVLLVRASLIVESTSHQQAAADANPSQAHRLSVQAAIHWHNADILVLAYATIFGDGTFMRVEAKESVLTSPESRVLLTNQTNVTIMKTIKR